MRWCMNLVIGFSKAHVFKNERILKYNIPKWKVLATTHIHRISGMYWCFVWIILHLVWWYIILTELWNIPTIQNIFFSYFKYMQQWIVASYVLFDFDLILWAGIISHSMKWLPFSKYIHRQRPHQYWLNWVWNSLTHIRTYFARGILSSGRRIWCAKIVVYQNVCIYFICVCACVWDYIQSEKHAMNNSF